MPSSNHRLLRLRSWISSKCPFEAYPSIAPQNVSPSQWFSKPISKQERAQFWNHPRRYWSALCSGTHAFLFRLRGRKGRSLLLSWRRWNQQSAKPARLEEFFYEKFFHTIYLCRIDRRANCWSVEESGCIGRHCQIRRSTSPIGRSSIFVFEHRISAWMLIQKWSSSPQGSEHLKFKIIQSFCFLFPNLLSV